MIFLILFIIQCRAESFYSGIRQMGMGGASIAVVDDETSLMSNPAGLGKLKEKIITVIDPEVEINVNTQPVLGTSVFTANNPQKLLDSLNNLPNKHYHSKAQVFPSAVVPNLGFGLFGKYQTDAQVNSATNNFRLDYTNDFAAILGLSRRLYGGVLKVGANARFIDRTQIAKDMPSTSTGLSLDATASEGLGVASDIGILLAAPTVWLPTFSVVARDVGDTTFTRGKGFINQTTTRPDGVKSSVDVALALFPIFDRGTRSSFTVEYTNIGSKDEAIKHFHIGAEINVFDAVFLRAGMNQRYWTAGFEISHAHYQLQIASYGIDVGTSEVQQEDRRFDAKFAVRF